MLTRSMFADAGSRFNFMIPPLSKKGRARPMVGPRFSGKSESEHVEHRSRLNLFQFRRRIDEPLVPGAAQPDQDGDVLLAIDRKGHGRCVDAATGVELPQLLQRFGIVRRHFAGWLAGEDKVRSRKHAAQIGERRLQLAGDLAGGYIDRRHASGDLERLARAATGPELPWLQLVRRRYLDLD